ncbi:MAG TPA: hypothetical protein VHE13_07185 [Opitutus sp.]|nr:hypothetical protein [Opitutus sp.]
MTAAPRAPRDFLPWLLGALVATLVFFCAWLTQFCLKLRAENARLRTEQALTALELRAARNQLEAERILTAREHAGAAGQTAPVPPPAAP